MLEGIFTQLQRLLVEPSVPGSAAVVKVWLKFTPSVAR